MPASRLQLVAADGAGSSLSPVETLKSELRATETERGILVSLPGDVLFDFDQATIRADARPTLDRLAELITAADPPRVAIEGHTDSRGEEAYNQRLSEARAAAVRDYLAAVQDVEASKLGMRGFGERRPVAENQRPDGSDNPQGRARNRRVEIILERTPGGGE